MRALVKAKPERGIWLEDIDKPTVGHNDVLIRVKRTAICGTDIHIYNWNEWAQNTIPVPMVVGHEFVGEIVEVGDNVNDFKPGQLVSGEGHVVCGRCRNCMAGRRHMCAHTSGIGVNRTGAFAEYISLPMANVWVHNPDIDQRIATIFDPFGNATHAALQFELLGEDVLITGAGPIGCMAGAICKHAGARHVVVTDMNPYRLDLAIKMGDTRAVDVSQESLTDVMEDLGMKEGFDVGLEMSGSEAAFNQMLTSLSHGGKVSMLGLPSNEMRIDWNRVVFNMLTIKGIYGREMYESWYKMAVMIQNGLDLSPVITHEYDIDDFQQGFDVMRSGQSGKVILDWTQACTAS